jgi:hypothetical protein
LVALYRLDWSQSHLKLIANGQIRLAVIEFWSSPPAWRRVFADPPCTVRRQTDIDELEEFAFRFQVPGFIWPPNPLRLLACNLFVTNTSCIRFFAFASFRQCEFLKLAAKQNG